MKINFISSFNNKNISNNRIVVKLINSSEINKIKNNELKNYFSSHKFVAKFLESCIVPNQNNFDIYLGIGQDKKLDELKLQKIGAKIFALGNAMKSAILIVESCLDYTGSNHADIVFGALLQSYRFNKYFVKKSTDKNILVNEINFLTKKTADSQKHFSDLNILAKNIFMVRDLVSEPSNILNPETYSKLCSEIKIKGLEIEVLGEKEMAKLGMNSLLGVGVGSEKESKLVVFKYNGGKKGQAPLAFVGKGVTFDTGGISIKPANNMEDMKTDMAGSAVVVGLMKNLAERKAKINAVGVIGLVENMPSGTAQRPGDVVKSMSGQTIEVINTDAEGRLVLADALHYTNTKFKPQLIVDLATLTGAIIVALADVYAGLFSNDDKLSTMLKECGETTGERVWRLPLGEEYDEMINSDIADMKNVGSGRGAGSITAAQFLQRFVGETKWAHLDIAGVAWKGKGDAMAHKGATGFGVKLLNELVKKFEK